MKLLAFFVPLLMVSSALAVEAPFVWPDCYKEQTLETSKTDKTLHFENTYYVCGKYERNENKKFGVSIVRPDKGKEYNIAKDGSVSIRRELPANYGKDSDDKTWTLLGEETINGKPALKYKVDYHVGGKKHERIFWLSADKKTPLRFEEGDAIVEYTSYSVGKQDAKLFEVPGISQQ